MMDLSGVVVRFYLSGQGRRALKGLVPARGSFQAPVLATSELGPFVWRSAAGDKRDTKELGPVMLLRWDYIATISFDYRQPEEPGREAMGFLPRGGRL